MTAYSWAVMCEGIAIIYNFFGRRFVRLSFCGLKDVGNYFHMDM